MQIQGSHIQKLSSFPVWLTKGIAVGLVLGMASCGGGAGSSSGSVGSTGTGYTIGGRVSGLANGASIVLKKKVIASGLVAKAVVASPNSSTDSITVSDNGTFTFPAQVSDLSAYDTSVVAPPLGEVCAITYGGDVVRGEDVTNVNVFCGPMPSGSFSPAADLGAGRISHTATLLNDGRVLVAGGQILASAELYDPVNDSWAATGSLTTGRYNHTATLLPNGKVLVTGGYNAATAFASAELYDPSTGTWSSVPDMSVARLYHTATLLRNGKVLVAGGTDVASVTASAEIYDPATNNWSAAGSLINARNMHTATLLENGRVLVAGGATGTPSIASAELYDPATNTWSLTGSLATARAFTTENILPDGKVLVAGGFDAALGSGLSSVFGSAELYDPTTGTWSAAGNMTYPRMAQTAISGLLPTGKVLMAGGHNTATYLDSAEIYDPVTNTWSITGSLAYGRAFHSATLMSTGRMLIVGGTASNLVSTEIY